jgi:hypothetical protein
MKFDQIKISRIKTCTFILGVSNSFRLDTVHSSKDGNSYFMQKDGLFKFRPKKESILLASKN